MRVDLSVGSRFTCLRFRNPGRHPVFPLLHEVTAEPQNHGLQEAVLVHARADSNVTTTTTPTNVPVKSG